jgi:hypothetical protein
MRDEPTESELKRAQQSPQKVLVDIDSRTVAMEHSEECATIHDNRRDQFFIFFRVV